MQRTTKQELQSIHEELELLRSEIRGLVLEVKVLIDIVHREQASSEQLNLSDMEVK